ncbi:structural maintenance of chromosomes protein 4 [Atheta coriaria]|uniref:structural maintenance of chromosomes protein 4 n=1 Tax=Dalotia coriaria TaxID=877792 RepID=UPI0031F4437D
MGRKSRPRAENDVSSDSDDELNLSDEEGAVRVDGIYIPPAPVPYCSVENKGPRLVITKIVNSFFKSYANNVVLGPFHKSFNSIIGPNGSGKSNVIDSMLFVFGFRANRMRSKKLSVLIHNSSKFTNVPSATVSVHFCRIIDKTDEEFEDVPNSEFVVSRTVNKDNSSYYTIGNRRVHFKEVAVLLKENGIDLKHNRFLILQGEVEQIAMMPAKSNGSDSGMLEYLEDIIGTTRYKEPLLQLAERVEVYWEKRTEKANRLKIVQDEVEVLREPMEEAVEFLKLENEIAREKNVVYQHNIYATKENAKEVIEEKEELEKEVEQMKSKLDNISKQKKEKQAELQDVAKKYEVMEKRKESLKEAYDCANSQHVELQAQMQQMNSDRHKYKAQLENEKKKLEKYQKEPKEIEAKIADCEKGIEKLTPKVEELQKEKMHHLATMKDLTKDLQSEKDILTEDLKVLKDAVTETKTAFTVAESELKVLTRNSDQETQKLQKLEATYEEIRTNIQQLTDETKKLNSVIPTKEKELQKANSELPGIKAKEEQLLHHLRSTRSKVQESKAAMQASSSKNRVLDALMQQKREGKIPGFYGRLGDLGAIDAKYDVAISTACGPLDNIVVDTVETGQWCIEFLKKHDIGRATVIVLHLQQHLLDKCNTEIQTPENAPRLFDLIRTPDARFRPAFYYALRDTLVANDLDQGSRIAYGEQRFRVVTLKGELIEISGAMSGGGNRAMRGRMGQSVQVEINPQELAEIEREMSEQEGILSQLRQKQNQLETLVATVQPELHQMKIANEKMSIELRGLQKREPTVVAQIKEQKNKVKRVSINLDKVHKMEKEVEEKKCAYDEAAEKAQVVQEKVDTLTQEIKDKSQGKVKVLDGKLKECNKNIDKLKTEITRLKVNINTTEKNAVKSEKLVESLQESIKSAENQLLQMKAKRDEIEADAAKFVKLIEDLSADILEGTGEYNDLKNDVKELERCETGFKSEKIELDQKMKTLKEALYEVEQKIRGFQAKLSSLKLQEIPTEITEPFKKYTDEELEKTEIEKVLKQIGLCEIQLRNTKPNLAAIEEYRKKAALAAERSRELDEVLLKWQAVRECYDNLRARRKDEFLVGYRIIKGKLKEMYQMITIGGDADFELVDTYDPFSEGVLLRVRPPKKTWKHISNLSGGEKTLSSLALVFALHYYKPSPLYVLDEIDAALDFKNVSIIANYIKERTKNAQFIIISLRNEMFELSCHLIGIYKPDNTTMTVTIDPRKFDGEKQVEQVRGQQKDAEVDLSLEPTEMESLSTIGSVLATTNGTVMVTQNTQDQNGRKSVPAEENGLPPSQEDIFASQQSRTSEISDIIPPSQEQEPETNMEVD